MKMMKGFSMQLGVRCHFCHEVNDNLTQGNFASDAKDEKQSARLMIKMVSQINADYISKVPDMPAPATCWTCHRGKSKPENFVPPAPGDAAPNSQSAPHRTPPTGTPASSGPNSQPPQSPPPDAPPPTPPVTTPPPNGPPK